MRLSDEMFLIFVDGSAVVVYLGAFWPAVVSVFDVLTAGYTMSSVSDALLYTGFASAHPALQMTPPSGQPATSYHSLSENFSASSPELSL